MRRRESRRRSRHNRTSKSPAMWPGFLAVQIVREYSLLLIFLCKIFPEKLDKARGGRRGILDSPFQSTPPARGATRSSRCPIRAPVPFQSTPPARGATEAMLKLVKQMCISIHAPREGGDCKSAFGLDFGYTFQSTPPARGATRLWLNRTVSSIISIHAPREGGDSKDAQFYLWIFDK